MKILHIPNYYSPHVGGIEQVCFDICESLKDKDIYQEIICFNDENDKEAIDNHVVGTALRSSC